MKQRLPLWSLPSSLVGPVGMTENLALIQQIEDSNLAWYRFRMAVSSYESALQMAESLPREEQLRLARELVAHSEESAPLTKSVNILDLCGLGKEPWQQMDAQEYVNRERASWNG